MQSSERSITVTIASGKGGVGKSVIAVNLAEALAGLGYRTALLDSDAGQSSCDILSNTTPKATIYDYARRTAAIHELVQTTLGGASLVVAATQAGRGDGKNRMFYESMDETLSFLRDTHEIVLIDAPAGTENAVRWAVDRSDYAALILVEEPTAITDAYRLAKLIWERIPDYGLASIVNYADSDDNAASVAERFNTIARHFTGRETRYLGSIPFSNQIRSSVKEQIPVVHASPELMAVFSSISTAIMQSHPVPQ